MSVTLHVPDDIPSSAAGSVLPVTRELDEWLPDPALRTHHRRASSASPERLWRAAREVRLSDAGLLGRLVRWRIPGVPPGISFQELFTSPPFLVLVEEDERFLFSGLVGRIWTLRRDYPRLSDPEEFRGWSGRGTARVLFANWVQEAAGGGATLHSEVRVRPYGAQGRMGVAAVRPLVSAFGHLVGSEGIGAAVRRAEHRDMADRTAPTDDRGKRAAR